MRARTLPCLVVLCLLGAGCSFDVPTTPVVRPVDDPSPDGIGWLGGGGRTADSTSTTADGIGWVGGGG